MREIKFRAWDASGEKPYMLGSYKLTDAIFNHKDIRQLPLMQFTGLHDKNGREIYEGDVVKIGANEFGFITNGNNAVVNYEVRVIECDYILYRLDLQLHWGRLSRLCEMGWDCEILGNIHENPELL